MREHPGLAAASGGASEFWPASQGHNVDQAGQKLGGGRARAPGPSRGRARWFGGGLKARAIGPEHKPALAGIGEPSKRLARPRSGPEGVAEGQWERPRDRHSRTLEPDTQCRREEQGRQGEFEEIDPARAGLLPSAPQARGRRAAGRRHDSTHQGGDVLRPYQIH